MANVTVKFPRIHVFWQLWRMSIDMRRSFVSMTYSRVHVWRKTGRGRKLLWLLIRRTVGPSAVMRVHLR